MAERNILDSLMFLNNVDITVRRQINGPGMEALETWYMLGGRKDKKTVYPSIEEMKNKLIKERISSLLTGGVLIGAATYYMFGHVLPLIPETLSNIVKDIPAITNAYSTSEILTNTFNAVGEPAKLLAASSVGLLVDLAGFKFLRKWRLAKRKSDALNDFTNSQLSSSIINYRY